jgi:exodeoxyribonuclease V alpha subunit
MLDIFMAESLIAALREHTRLILVGDSNQLPPIGPGQPFTDILRAHNNGQYVVPVYTLTQTHRQKGQNWVVDNAHKIIDQKMPSLEPVESPDGSFRFIPVRNSNPRSATPDITRYVIEAYRMARERGFEQQLQVLVPIRRPDPPPYPRATAYTINIEAQKALNLNSHSEDKSRYFDGGKNEKKRYQIYENDKVIFTRNMPKLGLSNGDTGVVTDVFMDTKKAENSYAKIQFDDMEDVDHPDGVYTIVGEHFQYVDLAYALTVHKSQGSEWQNVIFVADENQARMLKRQLVYTAITRTSKNLYIIGSINSIRIAINSEMQNERWTRLIPRLLDIPEDRWQDWNK